MEIDSAEVVAGPSLKAFAFVLRAARQSSRSPKLARRLNRARKVLCVPVAALLEFKLESGDGSGQRDT